MTCDWQGVKMPHALSTSLGFVSYGKYGGRIREADFGKRGDDAQGIELELPHCGSAAFLTRLGELGRKYAGCGCFFWTEI